MMIKVKMNEININIEGYNVNGICVGCLNYKRKMSYCGEVNECLRLLGNIDVPDGLTVQMCWECVASARATSHFRSQILRSYDLLIKYSGQHMFMNNPADLSKHATTRLSHYTTEMLDLGPQVDLPLMKPDDDDDEKKMAELPEIKEEVVDCETQAPSPLNTDYDQDNFEPLPPRPEQSSDEELQLSELKKKKEKKTRGKKKKTRNETKKTRDEKKMLKQNEIQRRSRKLKNLPEDLVELIKLDEEGMRLVRSRDVTSPVFVQSRARCEQCVLAFANERLKSDHMLAKHRPKGDRSVQCDVCHGHFLNADNLTNHRSLHCLAYLCRSCGFTTQLKRSMVAHVATHRERRATCRRCKKEFDTPSKLTYHRQMCHDSKPQCDCCGKVFANKMTLRSHLQGRARLTEPDKPGVGPKERVNIQCKGCDKVFPSKKSYRAHVVIHDGLQYPCPICGTLFQWKRNLARHLRNHADRDAGALHECKMCSKRFSSRDCLNNHMRLSKRHVPPENYSHECEYCGKKFPTKWCMVDHVDWEHLKKIKYQCSVCHKAFKTAKIMVAHMNNIHEGKRLEPDGEHLCEICGKSYKTVKRLKGHVHAMHTTRSTSKNFKCKLCPATFTWQTSIYKHMKCMHQGPRRHKPVRAPAPRPAKPAPEYGAYELAQRMHYYDVQVLGEGAPLVAIAGQQT